MWTFLRAEMHLRGKTFCLLYFFVRFNFVNYYSYESKRCNKKIMTSKIKVKIISWNVCSLPPPENLNFQNLFSEDGILNGVITNADIVVVGLQEVSFSINNYFSDMVIRDEPWSDLIKKYLVEHDYVQLSCGWTSKPRLMGLILLIFVKRDVAPLIIKVETKYVKTGFAGYSEYHMILDGLKFESSNIISNDYVFWFGDLNFRIENFTFDEIMRLIDANYVGKLLEYDQLSRCHSAERAFNHFQEGHITFKPTYKFVTGTSSYDSKREPAWCDRILYRVEETHRDSERKLNCDLITYNSVESYTNSDHKPVTASFALTVYNFVFEYLVTFLDNTGGKFWIAEQNNRCRYRVSHLYSPSVFDWIGIFKPNFRSDTDAVTWLYVASSWEDDDDESTQYSVQNIIFKKRYMPPIGEYLFGYYSRERSCLLSVSKPFQIISSKITGAAEATI